jgi:hypothetical protein
LKPAAADLGYYCDAESASGVAWYYLAAINLIDTRFGSIDGVRIAGAGPHAAQRSPGLMG